MTIRFGVVGCGVIGALHAQSIGSLAPDVRLVAVTDAVRERAEKLAVESGADVVDDLPALLARDDVDAVSVCLPSGLHADAVVAALESGRHVVVEKPADISLTAVDRMIAARDAAGKQVTVVSQHRFDPASVVVHEAVTSGRLGRLTSAHASVDWWRSQGYYDSGEWRGTWELDGGGALMNQGIHTVDLLCWMLGEPVEVFAYTGLLAHHGIEVEDTAVASVRFASGALASVLGTTAAYPGLNTALKVHGSRGSAVIAGDLLTYFHAAEGPAEGAAYGAAGGGDQVEEVLPDQGSEPPPMSVSHAAQYRDFVGAVTEGGSPLVTLEEARRSLHLVLAIYESARTGAPVRLAGMEQA